MTKKLKLIEREESYRRCLYEVEIKSLLLELKTLRAMAENLQSAIGNDVRLQLAPKSDKLADAIAKVVECEDRIAKRVTEYLNLTKNWDNAISVIDDQEQCVILRMRYMDGKSWKKIAEELFMSESAVFRSHKKAVRKLSE